MNRFRAVARLARVVDPRGDSVLDRLVEVVSAEDDERVVAAELENDLRQVPAGDLSDGGPARSEPVTDTPRTRGSAITHSICSFVA